MALFNSCDENLKWDSSTRKLNCYGCITKLIKGQTQYMCALPDTIPFLVHTLDQTCSIKECIFKRLCHLYP